MTIYCMRDGTQHPDDARYCMRCGQPLKEGARIPHKGRSVRWGYQDLVIPLGDRGYYETEKLFDQIVLSYLQRAGEDGWQADEPTSWRFLLEADRVDIQTKYAFPLGSRHVYHAVTIRVKRYAEN